MILLFSGPLHFYLDTVVGREDDPRTYAHPAWAPDSETYVPIPAPPPPPPRWGEWRRARGHVQSRPHVGVAAAL